MSAALKTGMTSIDDNWWGEVNRALAELGQPEAMYRDVISLYRGGISPKDAANRIAKQKDKGAS